MKCARQIKARYKGSRKYPLYGQEAIGSTWALAKMNMFLHGEDNHRIEWGDTLRNPRLLDGDDNLLHFDVVVANPPFSPGQVGLRDRRGRPVRALPPRHPAQDQGRLRLHPAHDRDAQAAHRPHGVVVPHGVLFRGGGRGQDPPAAHRGEPAGCRHRPAGKALLRHRHPRRHPDLQARSKADQDVLFIDASREFEAGKNQNRLDRREHRQDRRHLPGARERGQIRLPRQPSRRSGRTTTT